MSIPKEPRQLMINLMYLVLTALLALNVSAEIFNAFFEIDKGLEASNSSFEQANEFALTALAKSAEQDPEKYGDFVEVGEEVRRLSDDFYDYIEGVKDSLIAISGGLYDMETAPQKHLVNEPVGYKNHDITTHMLVNQGTGEEIKARIMEEREKLVEAVRRLVGEEDGQLDETAFEELLSNISLRIDTAWKTVDRPVSWSHYNFNHMPVGSVLPMLSKFQNDMRSSEAGILNFLVRNLGVESFKVDQFIPIASAEKSYVIAGESYSADITIGASSRSVFENMDVKVNGRDMDVNDQGIAEYSVRTSSTGVKNYNVEITLTNPTTGERETYTKRFSYEVGRRSVTVSADKMNVFYIGVDNPVSIAAAGVSSNDLRVSGSGAGIQIKRAGVGKYTATVRQQGEATVTVSGGGLRPTNFVFRAKRIPDPVAKLGNVPSGPIGNGTFKAQGGIVPWLENFDFDARCVIQGYEVVYVPARQDPIVQANSGGRFSQNVQRLIQRARPGDAYYFDDIKAKCPGDPGARKINSLVFRIR